jgi:hypothetical protein
VPVTGRGIVRSRQCGTPTHPSRTAISAPTRMHASHWLRRPASRRKACRLGRGWEIVSGVRGASPTFAGRHEVVTFARDRVLARSPHAAARSGVFAGRWNRGRGCTATGSRGFCRRCRVRSVEVVREFGRGRRGLGALVEQPVDLRERVENRASPAGRFAMRFSVPTVPSDRCPTVARVLQSGRGQGDHPTRASERQWRHHARA